MTETRSLHLTPEQRSRAGVLATLADAAENHVEAREFQGYAGEALEELASYCDEHGLSVISLSTPGTIFADVQGRPAHAGDGPALVDRLPEVILLNRIKRLDLLHPKLAVRLKGRRNTRRAR